MFLKLFANRKLYFFLLVPVVMLTELLYYGYVIQNSKKLPPQVDLVLVYSVDNVRVPAGINIARQCQAPYFMVSDKGLRDLTNEFKLYGNPGSAKVLLDGYATTTDQNARYTAPIIRGLSVKTVVLVTSWFHMPRALFLARLYLFDSEVKIYPYSADAAPTMWWIEGIFWNEYSKFWGSLLRVALAFFGIEVRK